MVSPDFQAVVPMSPVALVPPRFGPEDKLAPLARATIFVRDVDRSMRLYKDLLGLRIMFDHYWCGDRINTILGGKGLELRAVVLMAGESAQGNLGIYQLIGGADGPPQRTAGGARTGDFALVFPTLDIAGMSERVEAAGYDIVSPIMSLVERAEYALQPAEMMFRDADGVLVNLVQAGVLKGSGDSPTVFV